MLLEILGQAVGDDLVREGAHVGAAELCLGLALELRVRELDGDDGRQALADVITREVGLLLLEKPLLAGIVVDHSRKCRAEALEVHASLGRVDVVGKRHDVLTVAAVPLQGYLDLAHLVQRRLRAGLALDVDGVLEALGDVLAVIEEPHEVDDAAGIAELLDARGGLALVGEGDLEVLVEERRLLQAVVQGVEVVDAGLEDLIVGPEGHRGAGLLGLTHDLHLLGGLAAGKLHLIDVAVTLDLDNDLLGEGIHDGDAHAVKAAGHLVGAVVELAARVQDRHDDLERRDPLHRVQVDGDAAAVVDDRDGVVGVHRDGYLGAEAGHGLVDGVVHDLPYEVVQTAGGRRADVHARALADGLEALEDLDLSAIVFGILGSLCHATVLSLGLTSIFPSLEHIADISRPKPIDTMQGASLIRQRGSHGF